MNFIVPWTIFNNKLKQTAAGREKGSVAGLKESYIFNDVMQHSLQK